MISYKTKTIANFMPFIELPINIVFYVPDYETRKCFWAKHL